MKAFIITDESGYIFNGMVDGICCDEFSEEIPSWTKEITINNIFRNRRLANKELKWLKKEVFRKEYAEDISVKMVEVKKSELINK